MFCWRTPGKETEAAVSATVGGVVAGGPGGEAAASVVTGGWKPEPEAEDGGVVSPSDMMKNQSETHTKFRPIV